MVIRPSYSRCSVWLVLLPLVAGSAGCRSESPSDVAAVPETSAATKNSDSPPTGSQAGEPAAGLDASFEPQLLSEEELEEGWIRLFDGRTLFGWQANSDADWRIENGAIVVDSGEPGLLNTTSEFRDYELKVEFRCDPQTNSGIFLRTGDSPGDVARDCYELNIAPGDNPFPTGSLVQRQQVSAVPYLEDWRSYHVTVVDDRVEVVLNGDKVLEYESPDPVERGKIGLQLNSGRVEFRQILLKPLGRRDLLNGRDLTGWRPVPEGTIEVQLDDDGVLSLKGGPGQLETVETFADFVLQVECRVESPGLNSGVFFRCIPEDKWMGYESQIHNGFEAGDRSTPLDHGTGGIFRRQEARWVVADDGEWFWKTIVADGAHIAVWVNGFQVSDWIDTRPPDPNPRRGLRREAGTIMLQGHDPTTDFSFRDLRIATM